MEAVDIARYYNLGTLGSFSTKLMDLIGNADEGNKAKIALGFPEYIEAHKLWFKGDY